MKEIRFKQDYKYIIGVDPDLYKSGFAVYDTERMELVECASYEYEDLIEKLLVYKGLHSLIRLEAGWLVKKSNWQSRQAISYNALKQSGLNPDAAWNKSCIIAQRQSKNVGENHASGKLIQRHLEKHGYQFELVKPCGASSFFKDTVFFKKQTGWSKRTNNDARSAAALCYKY